MEYAQLNHTLTEATQVTTHGNVEWDATHFCPASALTPEEATFFRVVPLTVTQQPAFDPITHRCFRDGCEKIGGNWQYKWTVEALDATAVSTNLASARAALIRQIDADTDAIYRAVQGDRAMEYLQAEADAKVYKAAGYTGTVPDSVASWASAKAQTATWATDDILATATGWRQAQSSIRATRLTCKEQARTATNVAPIAAQWIGFVAAIKTALGVQ